MAAGEKNADYHEFTRRNSYYKSHRRSSSAASSSMQSRSSVSTPEMVRIPIESNRLTMFDSRPSVLKKFIDSNFWGAIIHGFIISLLFGPAIRDIWAHKNTEVAFDAVFLLTFIVLIADIVLRSIAIQEYFPIVLPSCGCNTLPIVGSFIFWCDLFSAILLLLEVELLFPCNFSSEEWFFDFKSGVTKRMRSSCLGERGDFVNVMLILNIFRAARIARLVQTSTIFKTSSFKLSQFLFKSMRAILPISYTYGNRTIVPPCPRFCLWGRSRKQYNFVRFHAACVIQRWWIEQLKIKKQRGRLQKKLGKHSKQAVQNSPPKESKVGGQLRETTSQHVVLAIFVTAILTTMTNFTAQDLSVPISMSTLHLQTVDLSFRNYSVELAKKSTLENLYMLNFSDEGNVRFYEISTPYATLRDRDIVKVTIENIPSFPSTEHIYNVGGNTLRTYGEISRRESIKSQGWESLTMTISIIIMWFIGIFAFADPLMALVLTPMKRMIFMLYFMSRDPLGYQNTQRFQRFLKEEENASDSWGEVLKGMETTFLMSTILRIGSLMKVGFGSAGVDIIRQTLEQGDDNLFLNFGSGTVVNCVFLFCDIRKFTDVTECLQEETFVFTNKIASVVHSICNAYGGSANANIGDAFLLSWTLPNDVNIERPVLISSDRVLDTSSEEENQADRALLSVIKINVALHHDNHFLEGMSETAKNKLLTKLSDRVGPIVQLGFGMHAGRAVQGAIGTPRKIDATYVSQTVEFAEILESATKRYGVRMLMSEEFYGLLSSTNRRRCRKIDQIRVEEDDEHDDPDDVYDQSVNVRDLYTFDMDIDELYSGQQASSDNESVDSSNHSLMRRGSFGNLNLKGGGITGTFFQRISSRRNSGVNAIPSTINEYDEGSISQSVEVSRSRTGSAKMKSKSDSHLLMPVSHMNELVLPAGPAACNTSVWLSDEMRLIRKKYSDGLFYPAFKAALTSFYQKNWADAKHKFSGILERFEDGPSRYFIDIISKNNGVPPRDFHHYNSL